jgi:hydrogenase maturation protease
MDALLVIGYGNPLRGDDGLGWAAAQRLQATELPGRHVLACQQLTPDLAEALSQAEQVVFIDAAAEGEPGAVVIRSLPPAPVDPGAFSHHVDPAGLLTLAERWYGHAPAATLITAAGRQFEFSETLSPPAEAALDHILRWVGALPL